MSPQAARWLEAFRGFVAAYRERRPIISADTAEHRGQRPILATHLSLWIDDAVSLPETHAVALTTSDIGIEIAQESLGRPEPLASRLLPRVLPVREIEYRLWTKDHPDPGHELHVNHWSWLKAPLPPQRYDEFRAWPLQDGEAYWLHRTGTTGPGEAHSRHAHLWKWTGAGAVLLQAHCQERVRAL